jgi:hypothetical protein
MNMRCVHLAKSLIKASHVCGSLLFVQKVILMNGTRKSVLYGDCPNCGVHKLYFYLEEKNGIDE